MSALRLLALWAVGGYVYDVLWRSRQAERAARAWCDEVGKPMLVVGAGTPTSSLRALLMGPQRSGDVNLDLVGRGPCPDAAAIYATAPIRAGMWGPPVCHGDAADLSRWPDGTFGAVLATHVAEHLADPAGAIAEWERVADRVYVVTPRWWCLHTWLHPGHCWFLGDTVSVPLWGGSGLPSASGLDIAP